MTRSAIWALSLLLLASGCVKKAEGERLMAQAQEHERRITALEEGLATERRELGEAVAQAHQKVEELQQVLTEATAVVTRNSADVGAEVEQLQQQLSTLEGQLAELQNALRETRGLVDRQGEQLGQQLRRFARSAGVDVALEESEIPTDPAAHLAAAQAALSAGQGSRARALFQAYVRRHGSDEHADDAQLAIGQSYLTDGQPARALGAFQKVMHDYPRGDTLDDALLGMGNAFFALHACTDARSALEALIRTQRRSPLVRRARAKLREIRRAPASACTS
ncbi:MAG: tetratricopeptide repeat protein [Deltaproteobacteria bacterium]|nr:tetratricopeptide repeat protein [Deltaproteobacteria bacterium]